MFFRLHFRVAKLLPLPAILILLLHQNFRSPLINDADDLRRFFIQGKQLALINRMVVRVLAVIVIIDNRHPTNKFRSKTFKNVIVVN